MNRAYILMLVTLSLALGMPGDAKALIVTGAFSGTITEIVEDLPGLAPAINLGDPINGTYTYDTTLATLFASFPSTPQSIWEFPAPAFDMTVGVGTSPPPEHIWTVLGPKPDVALRSTVSGNPFSNQFVLQGKTTSPGLFPNLPPGSSPVGFNRFILRGSDGMVNNGALTLPTSPSDINLSLATQTNEGVVSAQSHPFVTDMGWFFRYDIDTHIVGTRGIDQDLPILPTSDEPNASGGWDFSNVPGDGNWFDPPLVDTYLYETDGLSNFTELILPSGIDDDGLFTVTDASGPTLVSEGDLHMLAPSTTQFTVSGISPLVDGGDPLAFPTFLTFDQSTVSFTQTPIPEPAALCLAALSATCLLGLGRRRTPKL